MTAIADLLTPKVRKQLLERLDELDELAREMRQPGSLAAPDEPPPLHRSARDATDRTTS